MVEKPSTIGGGYSNRLIVQSLPRESFRGEKAFQTLFCSSSEVRAQKAKISLWTNTCFVEQTVHLWSTAMDLSLSVIVQCKESTSLSWDQSGFCSYSSFHITNYEAISFCCRVKNSLFAVPAPSIFIQSCVSGFIAQPDLKTTSMQPLE